jgi:PAS domain S-box-containing protein
MRLTHLWCARDADAIAFEQESRRRVFARGLGLPGLVWERSEPVWIPEVLAEHGCPRYALATGCGFTAAVAFPIRAGGEMLGVAEFFAREMTEPDSLMLDLFNALGTRIGQFLRRGREEARHDGTVRLLESVLEHSLRGVVLFDPDLTVKYWNPGMQRIFGWTAKEMLGMPYSLLVPEEHRDQFRRHYHIILAGREFTNVKAWRLRKDGSPVHVAISALPVYDAEHQVIGIMGIFGDPAEPMAAV